jgi:pimeloyl-ACP methyl ester carboxylesterase
MTTFVLVHGAFHGGWCFDLLRAELEAHGHRAIAPDLPIEDPAAGCARYAEAVLAAMTGVNGDAIIVGHSLGGLTIPLIAAERPVRRLVFLCAFIPWPQHSFSDKARTEPGIFPQTPAETWPVTNKDGSMSWPPERAIPALYADCRPDVATWAASRLRRQWTTPHTETCPLTTWPDVPSSYILARRDPAVGADWARHAATTRLHTIPDELDGGHSPFLSRPTELAALLSQIAGRG